MSDTPKTDELELSSRGFNTDYEELQHAYKLARQLERELAAATRTSLEDEEQVKMYAKRAIEAETIISSLTTLLHPHPGQSLADAVKERVEDAFREGKSGRPFRTDDEDLAWIHSDARRSFNPPPKVELRAPALGDVDDQFE